MNPINEEESSESTDVQQHLITKQTNEWRKTMKKNIQKIKKHFKYHKEVYIGATMSFVFGAACMALLKGRNTTIEIPGDANNIAINPGTNMYNIYNIRPGRPGIPVIDRLTGMLHDSILATSNSTGVSANDIRRELNGTRPYHRFERAYIHPESDLLAILNSYIDNVKQEG